MSLPSSPAPSSGSDDFAAFLDAELLSAASDGKSQSSNQEEEEEEDEDESKEIESRFLTDGEQKVEVKEGSCGEEEPAAEESDKENLVGRSSRKRRWTDTDSEYSRRTQHYEAASSDQMDSQTKEPEGSKHDLTRNRTCPPHPGYMKGVCIRCGTLKPPSEPHEGGVALRYIHEGLELSEREAAHMRHDELEKVLSRKKLYLVLDLDHTMLNSARFIEVPSEEECYLTSTYLSNRDPAQELATGPEGAGTGTASKQSEEERSGSNGNLYKLGHLQMWTKLRPFAHKFLVEASNMFEMYLYTMGERIYAQAMAQLLDPKGRFFGSRVISQGDSTCRTAKDLDIILGAESAVIILDDTEVIWPRHKANLILMERYHFFSSSCKQFGIGTASLVEAQKDESEEDGTLANTLNLLRSVHAAFFIGKTLDGRGRAGNSSNDRDVREVIQNLQSKVLAGCKVVFSRIFPTSLPCPATHPLWRLTEELGAVCTSTLDPSVTHVVSLDKGTDKARWAQQHKVYLVHPRWVEAALYTWKQPIEEDYPVGDAKILTLPTTFSKTVVLDPLTIENTTYKDGGVE